jgi:uncharacterized membrane protein YgdD (TMEM256/DUF423 family)
MNRIHFLFINPRKHDGFPKEHPFLSRRWANFCLGMNKIPFLAAMIAALGVGMGAFGAHALEGVLKARGTEGTWNTAVFYHLVHAVAAWIIGFCPILTKTLNQRAGLCWVAGIGFFSGSLYLLALGGPRWLGPITPIGGILFIIGWIYAARAAWAHAATKTS